MVHKIKSKTIHAESIELKQEGYFESFLYLLIYYSHDL